MSDIGATARRSSCAENPPLPDGRAPGFLEIYLGDGAAAVGSLYKRPRLALRQWAEDDALSALPDALDCELPAPPEGFREVLTDKLGFAGLLAFHTALGWDGSSAYAGALDWRADSVAGYASSSDPDAVVVAWRLQLEGPVAADKLGQLARTAGLDARPLGNELADHGSTRPIRRRLAATRQLRRRQQSRPASSRRQHRPRRTHSASSAMAQAPVRSG